MNSNFATDNVFFKEKYSFPEMVCGVMSRKLDFGGVAVPR
jgi:hypothetical protein